MPETYVHRIGRTGRAGLSGIAISFCDAEERPYLKDIQKLISKQIPIVDAHPYPMAASVVAEVTEPTKFHGKRNSHSGGSSHKGNSSGGNGSSKKAKGGYKPWHKKSGPKKSSGFGKG